MNDTVTETRQEHFSRLTRGIEHLTEKIQWCLDRGHEANQPDVYYLKKRLQDMMDWLNER